MPDLTQIVLRAQQMQADMERAQASLAESVVTGSAGGGLVTATVTGSGELTGLTLAPEVVDPQDTETLADLVIAAVRDANRRAQELSSEQMGAVTGGLTESFDLSSFGLGGFGAPGTAAELDDSEDDGSDEDDSDDGDESGDSEDDEVEQEAVALYEEGAQVSPGGRVSIDEAALIEAGQPDDGPADRAAPGRS
ncbi:DNA-binding YbaB/EbfC family protein [Nakamurella flavida]|nr:YbaB/EbfC family nucleoid-associated protein [Nakamurella flavida]MDP9779589.1 DNA-binding YbaB/EbfC family protein [Nakamurella flavida]